MTTKAVIFDLDGTLTVPLLDFDRIRRQIGISTGPVWEAMQDMAPWQQARTEAILLHHELAAARASRLNPQAEQVTRALRDAGIRQAILTRNCRRSVNITLLQHGLNFDAIFTREDGPLKPSPEPVLTLCRKLQVEPAETITVGDYLFDIQSGKAARTRTVLLCNNKHVPDYADQADHVIHNLGDLLQWL